MSVVWGEAGYGISAAGGHAVRKRMAQCPECRQACVAVSWGAETVLLDPQPFVYVPLEPQFPADGMPVALVHNACIEHRYVCPARWRTQLDQRAQHAKEKQQRRASIPGGL